MNNNTNNEKISFKEKMKDKKYNAKVQLIGYGIFIVIIIIYANISSKNYDYDYSNKITNSINNPNKTSEVVEQKSLLKIINNNYEYNIKIEIINNKEEIINYQYTGSSYKDIKSIKTNDQTYYLKNNEYYENTEGTYKITEAKNIYKELEYKYIELDQILNYLEKSTLDHTTNYSTGEIVSTYFLYLKDILPNYYEEDYVQFNVKEKDNNLNIEIDYSPLMNYKNEEIKNYKVIINYNNIGLVEEFDIETNTSE